MQRCVRARATACAGACNGVCGRVSRCVQTCAMVCNGVSRRVRARGFHRHDVGVNHPGPGQEAVLKLLLREVHRQLHEGSRATVSGTQGQVGRDKRERVSFADFRRKLDQQVQKWSKSSRRAAQDHSPRVVLP